MRKLKNMTGQDESLSARSSRIQFLCEFLLLSVRSSFADNGEFQCALGDRDNNRTSLKECGARPFESENENAGRRRLLDIAKTYVNKKGWLWTGPEEIIEIIVTDQVRIWQIRLTPDAHGKTVQIIVAEKGSESTVVESRYI